MIDKHRLSASTEALLAAIATKDPIDGSTHNFYRYPARFSPLFVREVISQCSSPGDVVLDPFMGGGTTVVEALSLGRKAVGVDINSLAHFVTLAKTTPLSERDFVVLKGWSRRLRTKRLAVDRWRTEPVKNLPTEVQEVCGALKAQIAKLPLERQRRFALCALLNTGRWAVDCKKEVPLASNLLAKFLTHLREMILGMQAFIEACRGGGLKKSKIRQSRTLLCRSAIGLELERKFQTFIKPSLVVTSPPYPAVHILYHRWQVFGRRETPAPYWMADLNDGNTASCYTFGSRSTLGLDNYFRDIEYSFRSIRKVISRRALVVQMVAFSDKGAQLPFYLAALERAGFAESQVVSLTGEDRVWRNVPNRKWYCHNGQHQDSSKEVVLFHRPKIA
jgi:hypothetical protein